MEEALRAGRRWGDGSVADLQARLDAAELENRHLRWDKRPPAPPLPPEVVRQTSEKDGKALLRITGSPLPTAPQANARMIWPTLDRRFSEWGD